MKFLGVDLGARRIGIAVSAGAVAVAHTTIERDPDPAVTRAAIVATARAESCGTVVVGIPRSLSGDDGPAARAARDEVDELRALAPDLEVEGHDERFTTVIASRELRAVGVSGRRARGRIDETAAAVMLQSYLDSVS